MSNTMQLTEEGKDYYAEVLQDIKNDFKSIAPEGYELEMIKYRYKSAELTYIRKEGAL